MPASNAPSIAKTFESSASNSGELSSNKDSAASVTNRVMDRVLGTAGQKGNNGQVQSGQHGVRENLKSLSVAVFYGVTSIGMNLLNKTIVSTYEFNFPFFIMTCQVRVASQRLVPAEYFFYINMHLGN